MAPTPTDSSASPAAIAGHEHPAPDATGAAGAVYRPSVSHWGSFSAAFDGDRLYIRPAAHDPDPSPLFQAQAAYRDHATRIRRPALREGWVRARLELSSAPKDTGSRGNDR